MRSQAEVREARPEGMAFPAKQGSSWSWFFSRGAPQEASCILSAVSQTGCQKWCPDLIVLFGLAWLMLTEAFGDGCRSCDSKRHRILKSYGYGCNVESWSNIRCR